MHTYPSRYSDYTVGTKGQNSRKQIDSTEETQNDPESVQKDNKLNNSRVLR